MVGQVVSVVLHRRGDVGRVMRLVMARLMMMKARLVVMILVVAEMLAWC